MTRWVYGFGAGQTDGTAAMKELLGGKGANLAEMCQLGLAVPPGFTLTTEVCRHYQDGQRYPDDLQDQVAAALGTVEDALGRRLGDAEEPLLLSVRSGAPISMPGMMDTVLNLGLNDETVAGPGAQRRRSALCLRQLPPLHPDVWRRGAGHRSFPVRGPARGHQARPRLRLRYRSRCRRPGGADRGLSEDRGRPARQAVSAGCACPAVGRDRRGVRLVGYAARGDLPASPRHRPRHGHRGQRAGHGVRQPGRRQRHRGGVHARSLDRREALLRRVPGQCPGRGRGRRDSHAPAADHRHEGRPPAASCRRWKRRCRPRLPS